jgi:YgiT-type zinc finger domain-containing protein
MRCFCGGTAVLRFEDIALFGGKLVLKDQPYYHCPQCGEDFSTGRQVSMGADEVREFLGISRKFISTGGSIAATIPPAIAKQHGIRKGKKFRLVSEGPKKIAIVVE